MQHYINYAPLPTRRWGAVSLCQFNWESVSQEKTGRGMKMGQTFSWCGRGCDLMVFAEKILSWETLSVDYLQCCLTKQLPSMRRC